MFFFYSFQPEELAFLNFLKAFPRSSIHHINIYLLGGRWLVVKNVQSSIDAVLGTYHLHKRHKAKPLFWGVYGAERKTFVENCLCEKCHQGISLQSLFEKTHGGALAIPCYIIVSTYMGMIQRATKGTRVVHAGCHKRSPR